MMKMTMNALLAAAALFGALPAAGLPAPSVATAAAGPAHLVADLNPGLEPFDPASPAADFNGYVTVGGRVLFLGFLPEGDRTQCGLWTVDPASGAAERQATVCSDLDSFYNSRLRWLVPAGGVAGGSALGYLSDFTGRLWRTDGTAAGTFVLGSVTVGGDLLDLPALGADGRTLFFSGCAPATGCEPWRSDGTPRGTRPLRDLAPGAASSNPAGFTRDGQRILFTVGGALWSTDGTGPGTARLAQIVPDAPGARLDPPLPYGGVIYVLSYEPGLTLWAYDPAAGRAHRLGRFVSDFLGRAGVTFEAVGGRLLIRQFDHTGGPQSLWEAKGTRLLPVGPPFAFTALSRLQAAGGRIVFAASRTAAPPVLWTLAPGMKRPLPLTGCAGGCPAVDTDLAPAALLAGRLYFPGRDAAHGRELWSTDGTAAGTRRVKDLCPGACDGGPAELRPALGQLVLVDQQGFLWASDGTPAGTVRLADTGIAPPFAAPVDLAVASGHIVFTALDPAAGRQPFVSDLTPAGTHLLAPIGPGLAASSNPSDLTPLGARLLFEACASGVAALYSSDGTQAGTFALPGTEVTGCSAGHPGNLFTTVGSLAFFDWLGKLWRTDGTAAGTFPVLTLPAGVSFVRSEIAFGGQLLFVLDPPAFPPSDDGWDWTVWTSDGTPAGTREAFPLRLGSAPAPFFPGGEGEVLFTAPPSTSHDDEFALWRTDGTAAGTRILLPGVSSTLETARLGGVAYFLAATLNTTGNLWTTDGTAAGTRPILPFESPAAPVAANDLTVFDGALYFFAGGTSVGGGTPQPPAALWRSDGTAAGTRLVKVVAPPQSVGIGLPFRLPELTVAGDHLFFRAQDDVHGAELWATDGTPEGTAIVKDIHPGPGSSLLDGLAAAGGTLYFTATDGEHGVELWQSDGTAEGTVMVEDLVPGPAPSNPEQLTAADGLLCFTADDGVHGREPWALPLP